VYEVYKVVQTIIYSQAVNSTCIVVWFKSAGKTNTFKSCRHWQKCPLEKEREKELLLVLLDCVQLPTELGLVQDLSLCYLQAFLAPDYGHLKVINERFNTIKADIPSTK